MYKTDFIKKTEDGSSLLEFMSERDETLKSIQKRNKFMRMAYIGMIALCAILSAYVGVSMYFN